jgi:shikimate dehydrogenase
VNKQPSKTVLLGLIGTGIQASRSPHLHEAEARAAGFSCSYRLLDLAELGVAVAALPRLLDRVQAEGFAGVNITHPCKQAVIPLLDELTEEAALIGAVNTVVFAGGRRIGHNTDWWGFAESFKRGLRGVALGRAVLLGAGGAGAAVAHAALRLGIAQLAIYDAAGERALALADRLNECFGPQRAIAVSSLAAPVTAADGLIQATPVGMVGHPGLPLPAKLLRPELWVAELIYFPLETELLKRARALGCRALDGGGMAVFQAAEAFRLFHGVRPNHERMLRHFGALGREA